MAGKERGAPDPLQLRQRALSRWDNEGGAGRQGRKKARSPIHEARPDD